MRKRYDLSGDWQLRLDEERTGVFENGHLRLSDETPGQEEFDDRIILPSTTAMAGKSLHGVNEKTETYFLTEKYPFYGCAWYQRKYIIRKEDVGKPAFLYLERTRLSKVWINGREIGSCSSICAPHRYDITGAVTEPELLVTICVNNVDYPTKGGHMTSQDTQTNWNGILGRMELQIFETADVVSMTTEADPDSGEIKLFLETRNTGTESAARQIRMQGNYYRLDDSGNERKDAADFADGTDCQIIRMEPGCGRQTVMVKLENPLLFSEFTPGYGELQLFCESCSGGNQENTDAGAKQSEPVESVFGFRKFTADRHHFYINGTKTFLRGKHDGMVFPLTGAAPMDTKGWLKVMSAAKSFGINHYRFHTCCPPEAAFYAADLLGIYMEPELPFWGTIADPGEEGYNGPEQDYLIEEGFRLMKAFGSHPSFVMMSLGNELWGSGKRLGEILNGFKAVDRRHLYTSGSNNFQFYPFTIPEEDFFAGVRFDAASLIRGSYAMCDAPQGFVQTEEPNTVHSYDSFFDSEEKETEGGAAEIEIQYGTGVKKVKAAQAKAFRTDKPVLSHEVGQYCTYPDYREISHYTGVLEARNFQEFRRRLEKAGMLSQAEAFFRDSGALAAFCYKMEIEAAHRSRMLAGYQLLDIQDFPGQGTALVGILNSLMEEKGIISRESWRGFCGETVVLAELPRFVYTEGEELAGNLLISHYGAEPLSGLTLKAVLAAEDGTEQMLARIDSGVRENGVHTAGDFRYLLPAAGKAAEYCLKLTLEAADGRKKTENSYRIYTYPAVTGLAEFPAAGEVVEKSSGTESLYITGDIGKAAELLQGGRRVLLVPEQLKNSVPGTFCTDFWCYPMFRAISESMNRRVPAGTLGLTIRKDHAALKAFGSDTCSTPQWYGIVTESDCAVLSGTGLKPIVQVIDNFERNHKLGMLFEARCANGRLLVCTSRLKNLAGDAAAENFYQCLVKYGLSEEFQPEDVLSRQEFEQIFGEGK